MNLPGLVCLTTKTKFGVISALVRQRLVLPFCPPLLSLLVLVSFLSRFSLCKIMDLFSSCSVFFFSVCPSSSSQFVLPDSPSSSVYLFLCVRSGLPLIVPVFFFVSIRALPLRFFSGSPLFRSFFFFRCLCSAFYRARELSKTSPCYSPAFTGLLINPRSGSWAKDVVHERIELLQFSLLNRLSPREIKGIVNSSSKRRRLCPWE